MNLNEQKEQFSLAYIRAVAAQAGYQITKPELDNDSVDGTLIADCGRRPRLVNMFSTEQLVDLMTKAEKGQALC